jgi:hypothetical protein
LQKLTYWFIFLFSPATFVLATDPRVTGLNGEEQITVQSTSSAVSLRNSPLPDRSISTISTQTVVDQHRGSNVQIVPVTPFSSRSVQSSLPLPVQLPTLPILSRGFLPPGQPQPSTYRPIPINAPSFLIPLVPISIPTHSQTVPTPIINHNSEPPAIQKKFQAYRRISKINKHKILEAYLECYSDIGAGKILISDFTSALSELCGEDSKKIQTFVHEQRRIPLDTIAVHDTTANLIVGSYLKGSSFDDIKEITKCNYGQILSVLQKKIQPSQYVSPVNLNLAKNLSNDEKEALVLEAFQTLKKPGFTPSVTDVHKKLEGHKIGRHKTNIILKNKGLMGNSNKSATPTAVISSTLVPPVNADVSQSSGASTPSNEISDIEELVGDLVQSESATPTAVISTTLVPPINADVSQSSGASISSNERSDIEGVVGGSVQSESATPTAVEESDIEEQIEASSEDGEAILEGSGLGDSIDEEGTTENHSKKVFPSNEVLTNKYPNAKKVLKQPSLTMDLIRQVLYATNEWQMKQKEIVPLVKLNQRRISEILRANGIKNKSSIPPEIKQIIFQAYLQYYSDIKNKKVQVTQLASALSRICRLDQKKIGQFIEDQISKKKAGAHNPFVNEKDATLIVQRYLEKKSFSEIQEETGFKYPQILSALSNNLLSGQYVNPVNLDILPKQFSEGEIEDLVVNTFKSLQRSSGNAPAVAAVEKKLQEKKIGYKAIERILRSKKLIDNIDHDTHLKWDTVELIRKDYATMDPQTPEEISKAYKELAAAHSATQQQVQMLVTEKSFAPGGLINQENNLHQKIMTAYKNLTEEEKKDPLPYLERRNFGIKRRALRSHLNKEGIYYKGKKKNTHLPHQKTLTRNDREPFSETEEESSLNLELEKEQRNAKNLSQKAKKKM